MSPEISSWTSQFEAWIEVEVSQYIWSKLTKYLSQIAKTFYICVCRITNSLNYDRQKFILYIDLCLRRYLPVVSAIEQLLRTWMCVCLITLQSGNGSKVIQIIVAIFFIYQNCESLFPSCRENILRPISVCHNIFISSRTAFHCGGYRQVLCWISFTFCR